MNKIDRAVNWYKDYGPRRIKTLVVERESFTEVFGSIEGESDEHAFGIDGTGFFCGCIGQTVHQNLCSHLIYAGIVLVKSRLVEGIEAKWLFRDGYQTILEASISVT